MKGQFQKSQSKQRRVVQNVQRVQRLLVGCINFNWRYLSNPSPPNEITFCDPSQRESHLAPNQTLMYFRSSKPIEMFLANQSLISKKFVYNSYYFCYSYIVCVRRKTNEKLALKGAGKKKMSVQINMFF